MKYILFSAALCLSITCFGNPDTVRLQSSIKKVTVFFRGAQIERSIDINLTKGKHWLVLEQLSDKIIPGSIQFSSLPNSRILATRYQVTNNSSDVEGPAVLDLKAQIRIKELKDAEYKSKARALRYEEALLRQNMNLSDNKNGLTTSDLKLASELYRTRINEITMSRLELNLQVEEVENEIRLLYKKLNEVSVNKDKMFGEFYVLIDCNSKVNGKTTLNYYVHSAGWIPTYDLRVENIASPISIAYYAQVFQTTGEIWNNVKLTISGANPSIIGNMKELEAWELGINNFQDYPEKRKELYNITGKVVDSKTGEGLPFVLVSLTAKESSNKIKVYTDISGKFSIRPVNSERNTIQLTYLGYQKRDYFVKGVEYENQDIEIDEENTFKMYRMPDLLNAISLEEPIYKYPQIMKDETSTGMTITREQISQMATRDVNSIAATTAPLIVQTDELMNMVKENITHLEYVIDEPHTILSDGKNHEIQIKEVKTNAEYRYHAIPKISQDVFLTAQIANWQQLNFIKGTLSVYFQGTYVGTSLINTEIIGDTLKVSLGRDKDVILRRELVKRDFDKRILSGTWKRTDTWAIVVKNNKNHPIKIDVTDQFPLARVKGYEVEHLELNGAKHNQINGSLNWTIDLNPMEVKSVSFKYMIRITKKDLDL